MKNLEYFMNMLSEDEQKLYCDLGTVNDLLAIMEERYKGRVAVGYAGVEHTYDELLETVAKGRGKLAEMGVEKGSHVGIYADNSYEFVYSFFAATSYGCVAVLLPPQLPAPAVAGSAKKYNIGTIIYGAKKEENAMAAGVPAIAAAELLNGEAAPAAELKKEDPAVIVFTGGTTGTPKGALLSHAAIMRGTTNGIWIPTGSYFQRYLSVLPMTHVFGLIRNMLTSQATGSALYISQGMQAIFKELQEVRPTIMILVPALVGLLLKVAMTKGYEAIGGALKIIIAGAAPVPKDYILGMSQFGVRVLPGYGLTESANLVSGNGDEVNRNTSVGKTYPGQQLKVVDGELWIKGETVMECYYNDPIETAAAMEDGWFKTGDLVSYDEEGFLYIVGRIKNLIITESGENVSPEVLEAMINTNIPVVMDSLVYEGEGAKKGKLILEVLPNMEKAAKMGIEDVAGFIQAGFKKVNDELPTYMQMQELIIREEDFPRSPAMKIIRPAMR